MVAAAEAEDIDIGFDIGGSDEVFGAKFGGKRVSETVIWSKLINSIDEIQYKLIFLSIISFRTSLCINL